MVKNPAAGAGRRNERGDQFLPFGLPGIDRDRPLSLVQADPIQALAVLIHRPAFRIEPAANWIEADYVAPSCASVMPASGAATKADPSMMRRSLRI